MRPGIAWTKMGVKLAPRYLSQSSAVDSSSQTGLAHPLPRLMRAGTPPAIAISFSVHEHWAQTPDANTTIAHFLHFMPSHNPGLFSYLSATLLRRFTHRLPAGPCCSL